MSFNFAAHATCPLIVMTYKYSEQVSDATHKLNYIANFIFIYFPRSVPKNRSINISKLNHILNDENHF